MLVGLTYAETFVFLGFSCCYPESSGVGSSKSLVSPLLYLAMGGLGGLFLFASGFQYQKPSETLNTDRILLTLKF